MCVHINICAVQMKSSEYRESACLPSERRFCYSVLCVAHSGANFAFLRDTELRVQRGHESPRDENRPPKKTFSSNFRVRLRWLRVVSPRTLHRTHRDATRLARQRTNATGQAPITGPPLHQHTRSENENRSPRESREHRRAGGVSVALRWQGAADTHTHT